MLAALRAAMPSKPPGYVTATIAISIAGLLNGLDTGSIGAVTVMPYFQSTFGVLSPFIHGLTVSIIMLTGAFPSLYAGQMGDNLGRLKTILVGALLFTVGAAMQASAHRLSLFIAGRAIGGIGMGTWMSPLAVYVTEIAPSARRGTLMAGPQLAVTAGICLGYFTAYGTVRIDSPMSFRSIYILQALAGLALAAVCLVIPESPRWALLQGQREQAVHLLKRLDFAPAEAEKDVLGPAAQRQITAQPGPIDGLIQIFRRPYRSRTTLALVMLGMIQLSGIDGVLYYAPVLFNQAGLPKTTASFIASGLSAILMFAITIPTLILVDRVSRRSVTLVGGLVLTACMFTIGSLYAADAVHPTGGARFVVVVLVFVFGLTYCATWGVVGKIYASEIQPAQTRSAANCVAQGLGFLTNWFVAMITPVLLARSTYSAYFLFGAFCLVSVAGLWCYMPETRGQSLEAIEDAFKNPLAGGSRVTSFAKRWIARKARTSGAKGGVAATSGSAGLTSGAGSEAVVELADVLAAGPPSDNSSTLELGAPPAVLRVGSI